MSRSDELSTNARKALAEAKVTQILMDAVAALENECRASSKCWPYTSALEVAADRLREMVAS